MKKQIFGKKLQRDTNERKALFKSLISALVLNEQIKTTKPKAQAIRADVEKLVTKLKNADEQKAKLFQGVLDYTVFTKLYKEIAPRFKNRNGGYTRLLKIGNRVNDNADMVVMEWVEKAKVREQSIKNEEKSLKTAEVKTEKKEEKTKAEKVVKKEVKKTATKKGK